MSKIIPFTRANHEEEVYLERCLNLTLCCKEKKVVLLHYLRPCTMTITTSLNQLPMSFLIRERN